MSDQSQGPGWWLASDGKWYPPEVPPGPTPYAGPPTVPSPPMNGCLKAFLIGVAVLAGLVAVSVGVVLYWILSDDPPPSRVVYGPTEWESSIEVDVVLLSCNVSDYDGSMAAQVQVTNNSSDRWNYTILVKFKSADGAEVFPGPNGSYGEFLSGVEPGQTASVEVRGDAPPAGGYVCEVTGVQRYSE